MAYTPAGTRQPRNLLLSRVAVLLSWHILCVSPNSINTTTRLVLVSITLAGFDSVTYSYSATVALSAQ